MTGQDILTNLQHDQGFTIHTSSSTLEITLKVFFDNQDVIHYELN